MFPMAFVGLLSAPVTLSVVGCLLAGRSYLVFVTTGILCLDCSGKCKKRAKRGRCQFPLFSLHAMSPIIGLSNVSPPTMPKPFHPGMLVDGNSSVTGCLPSCDDDTRNLAG